MANTEDYLTTYRQFFQWFAQTVNPNDQLPVKLASYKLLNVEVVGGIIDWTTQYLTQKQCPPQLLAPIIKIVIEEIRSACKKNPQSHGFNMSDNAYEPLKLMQTVMAKTNEVCLRYLDNSVLSSLPTPTNTYYETSVCAVRNRRRMMEDRHVVVHDLNTMFNNQEASPSSYYAVFDGHAGHDAAAYGSAHLHQYLAENKHFISNPEQALIDAFCKTDALFLEKCEIEGLSSGTTAVVALLRPKEKSLYIAWIGDSQAILVKQGKALQCVDPHKPSREDEKERIEKAGGCVLHWGTWRVNGQLAVSRAIGDSDYKPYVIAIPDVREIPLDGGEDFLILACDGLWDVLSEQVTARTVYCMLAENPDNADRIASHLAETARYEGSTDNITVIVVFLKEPHKIAAEAHRWAIKKGLLTTLSMDTELDNANNPYANCTTFKNLETDNLHLQKNNDDLLLNLTDNFKAVGSNLTDDFFVTEKSNGTKLFTSDDDFGPETNVDAVDDADTPVEITKPFTEDFGAPFDDVLPLSKSFSDEVKALTEGFANNNPLNENVNPFTNKEPAEDKEDAIDEETEEEPRVFCRVTPPFEPVHDVSGLEENPADSDSEDEWNYIKGDQAKPENSSSQPETVVETAEDTMSQLNPNAAEFVPVSPTRSIPSPPCRNLINEEVIAQSPKRPLAVDLSLPNEKDFEKEIKSRPSDVDAYSNGHTEDESDHNNSSGDLMENILNGRSIDDIPEFHPGSTPTKLPPSEEFHFGPNAAPFTPRLLDQSEAFSTKANFGDETEQTLNESEFTSNKETEDPMSMSFYAEKGEANPFEDDLNKVHELPENLDEFLQKGEQKNESSSRHVLLSFSEKDVNEFHDNDQAAIQTTDLDKLSQDDEKELASPLEPDQDLDIQQPVEISKLSSDSSGLLDDFVVVTEQAAQELPVVAESPVLEIYEVPQEKSPLPEQILDLGEGSEREDSKSPLTEEFSDVSKSPLPEHDRIKTPEFDENISHSPLPDSDFGKSPLPELQVENIAHSPLPDDVFAKSPVPEQEISASPIPDDLISKSPVPELEAIKSPVPDDELSKSPIPVQDIDIVAAKSPEPDQQVELIEPVETLVEVQTGATSPEPTADLLESKSPIPDVIATPVQEALEVADLLQSAPVSDLVENIIEQNDLPESAPVIEPQQFISCFGRPAVSDIHETEFRPFESPKPTEEVKFGLQELAELQAEKHDEEIQEEITSSVKDDISSPNDQLSPVKSPEPLFGEEQTLDEPSKPVEPVILSEQIEKVGAEVSEKKETLENLVSDVCCLRPTAPEVLNVSLPEEKPLAEYQLPVESAPVLEAKTEQVQASPVPPTLLANGFDNFVSQLNEEISIKTESIQPEFAEQAVITPSEESKILDDVPTAPLVETPVEEPKVAPVVESLPVETPVKSPEPLPQETPKELPVLAPIIDVAIPSEPKKEEKKAPGTKKLIGKVAPSKTTAATSKLGTAAKTTARLSASTPKTGVAPKVPPKTGASRLSASPAKAPATTKPTPKPKTTPSAAPKSTERKPLTNGDVKPAPRAITRKPISEATATKTTARPSTAASKPTTTKTTTAPRPATAPKAPARPTNFTSTKAPASLAAAKPKTSAATARSSVGATRTVSSSTTTKPTVTSAHLSPRTATAPRPKTLTSAPPKPKAPLTKTITKSADIEKQNKESANKITASRTTTLSKTTSSTVTSSRTTALKKTEIKPLARRPLPAKTSTTTMKTTVTKKPGEVKTLIKTKTTKVEKPKENGIAPATVTEEIKELTIVSNNIVEIDNLVKDNSPIDNKLLNEGSAPLIEPTPVD